jgi:aminoglycoside phosphotransferase (APT) family kinase protein
MTANVWDAERVVEIDEARNLIRQQFPQIEGRRMELFGVGWDNTAYLVDNEYVFRFPRRQIAVPLLVTESKALPFLARRLPLEVPNPKFPGAPTDDYEWPFLGYPLLQGQTACRADLTLAQRSACVEPLANFLRTLHTVPAAESREWGLPDDPLQKCNPEKRMTQLCQRLDQIEQMELFNKANVLRELAQPSASIDPPLATTTVHGDLYFRHLLVDSQHKLAAVIDWGDLHIGSPATDLSVAHSFLPRHEHDRFRRTYGEPISDETWELARMRAIFVMSILLLYGHNTHDEAACREAATALEFIADAGAA